MSSAAVETPDVRGVDMKLEIVVIPVSDVDRAKRFYGARWWCWSHINRRKAH